MKKINKLLLTIVVAVLCTIIPKVVNAKELVVPLPSNEASRYDMYHMTLREMAALSLYMKSSEDEEEVSYIYKDLAKEHAIIKTIANNEANTIKAVLLPDVTEEDCIVEVPTAEEIGTIFQEDENSKGTFIKAFEGYDTIRFTIKNISPTQQNEKVVFDYTKGTLNGLDSPLDYYMIYQSFIEKIMTNPDKYGIKLSETENSYEFYRISDNKLLFFTGKNETYYELTVGEGVTYKDNMTISFEEGDYIDIYGGEVPDRVTKSIEFRFGNESNPLTSVPEVVPIPNTAETIPLYVYLIGTMIFVLGIGTVGYMLLRDKEPVKEQ